jgi:uncharacterized protein YciI
MLHVLILNYTASPSEIAPHVHGHVDYLERHHSGGVFLFSGQTEPIEDGGVILARGKRSRLEEIAAEDPFVWNGVAAYEIISADAGRAHPNLAELLDRAATSHRDSPTHRDEWTSQKYYRLRADAPDLAAALTRRPLDAVLQRAGTAVLGGLRTGTSELADQARRCAAGLRERGWDGDDLLAEELEQALGQRGGDTELVPVPVDLEELALVLDSDPAEGEGALDPLTGEVLPAALLEFESSTKDDAFGEHRRLAVVPDNRAAYQDMADFADTIASTGLRERLLRALRGRGAFGRFKNAVHDGGGDDLCAWTVFREERALGRARRWLAECGYRAEERGTRR